MRNTLATVFLILGLCLLSSHAVDARPQRPGQIPNGNDFGCANCHVSASGGGSRNAFGQAVENGFLNGSGANASVNWNASLAAADSDGDGFTNGTELGDPDGDGNPTAGATVTNPGDATSFPQIVNRAPVIRAIGPQGVLEGEMLTFGVTGSDEDGDTLTFTASNLPEGAVFEDETFIWVPGFDLGGSTVLVTFTVSDGSEEASLTVDIAVSDVNRPVTLNSIDPSRNLVIGMEGDGLTFTIDVVEPDGEAVTYAWIVNGAEDAEATGTLILTVPSGAQDVVLSVTAASADGSTVIQTWTITKMLMADFDDSGDVGFSDFLAFVGQFGKTPADADFDANFDLDDDGSVGFTDFLTFVAFFGLTA